MKTWNEIIDELRKEDLTPITVVALKEDGNRLVIGLEVYASALMANERVGVCRKICGEGYAAIHLPNSQSILIEKKY